MLFTIKKVTIRPPLSDEENARIAAIATKYNVSKERAVAELLKRGARLEELGDQDLIKMLIAARADYAKVRGKGRMKGRRGRRPAPGG